MILLYYYPRYIDITIIEDRRKEMKVKDLIIGTSRSVSDSFVSKVITGLVFLSGADDNVALEFDNSFGNKNWVSIDIHGGRHGFYYPIKLNPGEINFDITGIVALETSGNRYRVGYVTGNKLIYLGLKIGEFELIRMLVDVRRDYRLAKYFKLFLKEVKIDIENLPVTKSSGIAITEFQRTRQSDIEKEAAVYTANNIIN